jgi:drug/metabolite transporter (DMT)-like permease
VFTNSLLLVLVVVGITALWPINTRVLRRGGRSEALGVCLSATGLLVGLAGALILRRPILDPVSGLLGAIGGVAFAVGFCLIIFYCLRIGPSGPTATLNNLGMIWPVLANLLFFSRTRAFPWSASLGIGASVAAIILMAWSYPVPSGGKTVSPRWLAWALAGWALAGISNTTQFLSGIWTSGRQAGFVIGFYAAALIILFCAVVYRKTGWPTRQEAWAGIAGGGILAGIVLPVIIYLMQKLPVEIVFPITQSAPIVIILLIGRIFLKERLTWMGWAACLLGALSIALLGISTAWN